MTIAIRRLISFQAASRGEGWTTAVTSLTIVSNDAFVMRIALTNMSVWRIVSSKTNSRIIVRICPVAERVSFANHVLSSSLALAWSCSHNKQRFLLFFDGFRQVLHKALSFTNDSMNSRDNCHSSANSHGNDISCLKLARRRSVSEFLKFHLKLECAGILDGSRVGTRLENSKLDLDKQGLYGLRLNFFTVGLADECCK